MKTTGLLTVFLFFNLTLAQTNRPSTVAVKTTRITEPLDLKDISAPEGILAGIIKRYTSDRGNLNRLFTAPSSPTRRARFKQFYNEWLQEISNIDFDALSQQERVDYLLFKNHLGHELNELDLEGQRYAEMEPLIPFAQHLIDLEDQRRRLIPVEPARHAKLLTDALKEVQETRKIFEEALKADTQPATRRDTKAQLSKIKKTVAHRAFEFLGSLRTTLRNWFNYSNGYDPDFTWWVSSPYRLLDSTLQDYARFVRERIVGIKIDDNTTIIGDPIGRQALLKYLAFEMIPYTPEELIALANKEMAWCETEMLKASRELGYGDDWQKALEHVKNTYVEPGKQPALIRDLAFEAIDFVETNNLVTVPTLAKETWRMEMMTPERQLIAPFFLGGEVIQVSYPTNTMTHEQKMMSMRGNNPHFSRATVHHELIPGHHLQGFMNARYRTYRSIFGTPFWGEGWALYWELLLWDMNFPKSPENKIGMLFWRMHRCARIIFSLSFHLEKMTPQECIDLLVKRVGHELDNASAEVRRSFSGQYGPLYQCAYLLGGLQFRSLNRELVGSGKMTAKEYHDTILRNNSIPVEMVRAILTNQELKRDYTPQWKFYGVVPTK